MSRYVRPDAAGEATPSDGRSDPLIRRLPLPRPAAGPEERSAFARGRKERPLRLLLDVDQLVPGDRLGILERLNGVTGLELWRPATHPAPYTVVIDWDQTDADHVPVRATRDSSTSYMAVWPASQHAAFAAQAAREARASMRHAYRQRVLHEAAERAGLDVVVTDDPFLLEEPVPEYAPASMAPDDVVPIAGLFLRSRDDFRVENKLGLNRGLFYGEAAWALLPEAWRWFSAAVASTLASGDDALRALTLSAVERVDRALRARDRLHIQLQLEQNNDTADEALFYLDVFLIQLSGALDVVAQVAHIGLGMPGPIQDVGWRRKKWRKALGATAPALKEATELETACRDAIELTALLRNSIHGRVLSNLAFHRAGSPIQNLIELPVPLLDQFLAAARRRGGNDVWGLHPVSVVPGGFSLDAGNYVEALLPLATAALNELMRLTDVIEFPGLDAAWPVPAEGPRLVDAVVRDTVAALAGLR